jgi:hypothetical protein
VREIVVISALAIVIATYVWYSKKDGSWFNILTPQLFFAIPAMYVAQLARLSLNLDEPARLSSWFYVFACYCLPVVVTAVTLVHVSTPRTLKLPTRKPPQLNHSPWIFLLLGVLLYLPIAIEFRADLLNPRAIYEQTRSGYGLNFFLSTMMVNLGFVLQLFKTKHTGQRLLFFSLCATLGIAHGSKGSIMILGLLWLIHWRYADGQKISGLRATLLLIVSSLSLVALFYFFSTGIELAELANRIIGYSDYTSNGLMVVNDNKPAFFGRIILEDNLFSRIPRALFPDKPKDFGSFYLAQLYFPESFELDQGAPAFGVGTTFADFKWFALPILCFASLATALLTKTYQNALAKYRHPGDFIVLAFLSGVPMISVGVGFLLPEHLLLSALLTLSLRLRFSRSSAHLTKSS